MPTASPADKARLAHRVLRLKENGVDSSRGLNELARHAPDTQGDISLSGPSLSGVALHTRYALDPDAPGPTDEKFVTKLFDTSLEDIWKLWQDNSKRQLAENDPDAFAAQEKADEKAAREYERQVARMQETGEWQSSVPYGHYRPANLANALYDLGRQGFLDASIDWDTAVIKCVLVDSADYTVNLATHQFMSSVTAGVEETSGAFANKTVTAGVADADDITFTAAAGDPCEALVIYQSSAVTGGADVAAGSQRLIAYIDTATGLPVTLNGGNVTVTWDSGSLRIFKL
jgi:hypothetical protein